VAEPLDVLGSTVVGWSCVELCDELLDESSPELSSLLVVGVVVTVVCVAADAFFAVDELCVAWAASPAKMPVPATAPATAQRVSERMRRRPASRWTVGGRFML